MDKDKSFVIFYRNIEKTDKIKAPIANDAVGAFGV